MPPEFKGPKLNPAGRETFSVSEAQYPHAGCEISKQPHFEDAVKMKISSSKCDNESQNFIPIANKNCHPFTIHNI